VPHDPRDGWRIRVSAWIANARMYSVTPAVEAAWRELLGRVASDAGVALSYVPYPAPQPLESLWGRADLGAVFMCGYPVVLKMAEVVPLAAPIPHAAWAAGRALYRTDLIVREDSPYRTLEDTFGGRLGWTVSHSQSGFNALRHELLKYRSAARPALYREVQGNLVTARNVLDAVREGRIDVGPLDAYWHLLIARHAPALTRGVRVLASTPLTPIPGFVAAATAAPEVVAALREAFAAAARRPWFAALADAVMIDGFAPMSADSYRLYLDWDAQARAAGYEVPA
jgi:ABC-type phosphate/phosphonate transport system substrate-binding protein